MKTRGKFLALFAAQALLAAVVSVVFSYGAMARENARAEREFNAVASPSTIHEPSADPLAARDAALAYAEALRASQAAARVFRAQAAVEAAMRIGLFSLIWAACAALLFALASRGFTKNLDRLAAGAALAGKDRSFRFPEPGDPEFGAVNRAFNETLDLLAEQENQLREAAALAGWKEVSSFLFHQLRNPLSTIEFASRNIGLAMGPRPEAKGKSAPGEANEGAVRDSLSSIHEECRRIRALLERFKSLSGLSMGPLRATALKEIAEGLEGRIIPGRVLIEWSGPPLFVRADAAMLEEALLNIALNAAEAAAVPPARLFLQAREEGGRAALEIRDGNGAVDPEIFTRIGNGRYSTKPEGTGLGLLFVRRVAALHGGSLGVFPAEDGGFGLRLELPSAEGAKDDAARSPA